MRITFSAVLVAVAIAVMAMAGAGNVLRAQTAAVQLAAMPVAPLGAPVGEVVLTVRGAIGAANTTDGSARFDAAMLEGLPRTAFATSTIWTEGVVHFAGVDLLTLLQRLGVTSGALLVTAINDYSVRIPVADLRRGAPILADRRNGQPMSIRDKGPLWLVYPYDSAPEFRNEVVYSRSVWQVDRIEVLP